MLNIKHILFATDGSACARSAHPLAEQLAEQFDAMLHVVHVVEESAGYSSLSEMIEVREADIVEQLRLPAAQEDGGKAAPSGLQEVNYSTVEGGILHYAKKHDIDLIVMGTHGHQGVRRMLLGSVAEEVVRRAPCPVLTVCGKVDADLNIRRVLVPVDLSEQSGQHVRQASTLAARFGASVHLMHVIEQPSLPAVYGVEHLANTDWSAVEKRVTNALQKLEEHIEPPAEVGERIVVRGRPVRAILKAADERKMDMIAIATHRREGLERLVLGSVAEKVIRMAKCPVFTARGAGLPAEEESSSVENAAAR